MTDSTQLLAMNATDQWGMEQDFDMLALMDCHKAAIEHLHQLTMTQARAYADDDLDMAFRLDADIDMAIREIHTIADEIMAFQQEDAA